jgi:DNA gyrase subunit A
MGLKELIQHFIEHRKEVITRRTRFLLRKAQQRGHILEGLIFAVCDIDEVIKLIRSSRTREEAIEKLKVRGFRIAADHPFAAKIPEVLMRRVAEKPVILSQAQAEAIGRLQLIQLVGLEIEKLVNEYREVAEEIEGYERILADENLVMDIIREDTFEMKEKYGDDRRTEITGEVSEFNMDKLIAEEDVVVTVSHEGYIKRLPVDTYKAQGRGGRGIRGSDAKEGDFIEHLFVANTHDFLLFFTNKGRVYERRVYDVPEMSRTSQGRSIANLLSLMEGEKVANVLAIKDFGKGEQFLMFGTKNGTVKKTALSAYANIRQNGLIAIGLDEGDSLIAVEITSGQDQILIGTKQGMAIRFNESDVRAMGRPAAGVKGIELTETTPPQDQSPGKDEVVDMIVVPHEPPGDSICMVLTACVNGFGKRTPVEEYRLQKRGGSGVINIKTTDRNGDVVGMKAVCDTDHVMLITEKGILMRTRVNEIRETGRNAAGVRLIKLDEGDQLVALAKVEPEEGEEQNTEAPPSEAPPTDAPPASDSTPGDGSPAS